MENAVNGWMQERLNLSYHIPIPRWASILLVLRRSSSRCSISSSSTQAAPGAQYFLWKKSIEDLHVNSLFQWLRDNVLLFIQLLILLVVIYSVLGFQVHAATGSGQYYIIIVDNSASMSVADVALTRLEAAKRAAINEIDGHSEGDVGMVIEFNSAPKSCNPIPSIATCCAAVQGIQQTQRATNIEEALSLADSLANPRVRREPGHAARRPHTRPNSHLRRHPKPRRRCPPLFRWPFSRRAVVRRRQTDPQLPSDRQARPRRGQRRLVAFNAGRDEQNSGKVRVFVRVVNYPPAGSRGQGPSRSAGQGPGRFQNLRPGDQPALDRRSQVHGGDPDKGELAADIPGDGIATFELNDVDEATAVTLHATLVGVKDAFPLDDEAWLVLGNVCKARIAIVTPGNEILRDFFDQETVEKVATITYLKPDELTTRRNI